MVHAVNIACMVGVIWALSPFMSSGRAACLVGCSVTLVFLAALAARNEPRGDR